MLQPDILADMIGINNYLLSSVAKLNLFLLFTIIIICIVKVLASLVKVALGFSRRA